MNAKEYSFTINNSSTKKKQDNYYYYKDVIEKTEIND